jgi:hypothetical protein
MIILIIIGLLWCIFRLYIAKLMRIQYRETLILLYKTESDVYNDQALHKFLIVLPSNSISVIPTCVIAKTNLFTYFFLTLFSSVSRFHLALLNCCSHHITSIRTLFAALQNTISRLFSYNTPTCGVSPQQRVSMATAACPVLYLRSQNMCHPAYLQDSEWEWMGSVCKMRACMWSTLVRFGRILFFEWSLLCTGLLLYQIHFLSSLVFFLFQVFFSHFLRDIVSFFIE